MKKIYACASYLVLLLITLQTMPAARSTQAPRQVVIVYGSSATSFIDALKGYIKNNGQQTTAQKAAEFAPQDTNVILLLVDFVPGARASVEDFVQPNAATASFIRTNKIPWARVILRLGEGASLMELPKDIGDAYQIAAQNTSTIFEGGLQESDFKQWLQKPTYKQFQTLEQESQDASIQQVRTQRVAKAQSLIQELRQTLKEITDDMRTW